MDPVCFVRRLGVRRQSVCAMRRHVLRVLFANARRALAFADRAAVEPPPVAVRASFVREDSSAAKRRVFRQYSRRRRTAASDARHRPRHRAAAILAELDSFLQAELALLVERREKLEKELADVALYCDTLEDACVVWEDDKLADVSATDAQNFQRISEEYIERLQTLTARLTERRQVKFVSVDSALQDCLPDIGCLHVSVVAADELDGSPAKEVISPAAEEPHSPAEEPRSQAVDSPAGQAAVEAAADDGTESTLRPPQCRRPRPRAVSLVSFLFYHAIILLFLF